MRRRWGSRGLGRGLDSGKGLWGGCRSGILLVVGSEWFRMGGWRWFGDADGEPERIVVVIALDLVHALVVD